MRLDLRTRLFVSQAAIMAMIMLLLSLLMGYFLDGILISNLDKFLHQESDNFKATISVSNNKISFHDLRPSYQHELPMEDEIPFSLQMLDINYKTVMLSGNRRGHVLYTGGKLPLREVHRTIYEGDDKFRQLITPVRYQGHHLGWVIASVSYHYVDAFRTRLQNTLRVATFLAIILLIITSYSFVRWSLRPVVQLADQANENAENAIFEALPVPVSDDEFSYLAKTFNRLLERAKSAIQSMERFSADASHELKTPLAVMRSELISLSEKLGQEQSALLEPFSEEISRMQQLIENLLIINQTNIPYTLQQKEFWLNDFLAEETFRIESVNQSREIKFDLDEVASIKVNTDVYLLYLIYNNLLRNAVRYAPKGSLVKIVAEYLTDTDRIRISVLDEGPGVPEEQLQHLFDRFYRLEGSRSRNQGGSGLGLSIAKWAAERLQGELVLKNRKAGGLHASVIFPSKLKP